MLSVGKTTKSSLYLSLRETSTRYHLTSPPTQSLPDSFLPEFLIPASPSTSTHHPSPPLVPPSYPPTAAAGNNFLASSSKSSSKLPGCKNTALMPASLASFNSVLVTFGGVITLRPVSEALDRALGVETVVYSELETEMLGLRGLRGVTGREWSRYQAKTRGEMLESE